MQETTSTLTQSNQYLATYVPETYGPPKQPGDHKESKITHFLAHVEDLAHQAGSELEYLFHPESTSKFFERFHLNDRLLAEFSCTAVNGTHVLNGYLYVTFNFLCFYSANHKKHMVYRVVIPIKDIMDMKQASITGSGIIPTFSPYDGKLRPEAVQITTNVLHQFYNFGWDHYDVAFNVLWHAWKAMPKEGYFPIPNVPQFVAPKKEPIKVFHPKHHDDKHDKQEPASTTQSQPTQLAQQPAPSQEPSQPSNQVVQTQPTPPVTPNQQVELPLPPQVTPQPQPAQPVQQPSEQPGQQPNQSIQTTPTNPTTQ